MKTAFRIDDRMSGTLRDEKWPPIDTAESAVKWGDYPTDIVFFCQYVYYLLAQTALTEQVVGFR